MSDSSIPGLATVQDEVASPLVHGATITDAANAVGLCRTTIYSSIKSEDRLRRALQYGRHEYAIGLRDDLRELAETALRALMDILRDPSVSPAVRTKTSMFIMKAAGVPEQGLVDHAGPVAGVRRASRIDGGEPADRGRLPQAAGGTWAAGG
jgi:AcrR family transcriptional regulator